MLPYGKQCDAVASTMLRFAQTYGILKLNDNHTSLNRRGEQIVATWSGIRHKLENDYLAECLRGRIQYYCTTYKFSHDREGRAAIRYDGQEIIRGCYYNQYLKEFPKDETFAQRVRQEMAFMDETALQLGVFDQRSFYRAFEEFDNQSIEMSLASDNLIVRIFAVLDRRVGKRRLMAMKDALNEHEEVFNTFFAIRASAEKIIVD